MCNLTIEKALYCKLSDLSHEPSAAFRIFESLYKVHGD